MPWVVQQENWLLSTTDTLAGQEADEFKSFNRCVEQYLAWMQGNWGWQGNSPTPPDLTGGDVNNPGPGKIYKVYFRTETSGDYHVEVRWTYRDTVLDIWRTNHVYFRSVFV